MQKESKTFLLNLLNQCGPSGFEEGAQACWSERTAKYADRVVLMAEGKIMADGKTYDILSNEELLSRWGLSPPTAVSISKQIGLPPMITVDEISQAIWGT